MHAESYVIIDARFDTIDARFEVVDRHLEGLDGRLAKLESRFDDPAREIRGQICRLTTAMVALVGVVVAAVRL